jgi:hypothetical protein
VPNCHRIPKQLKHFFRALHRVFVLQFVQCGIFVALVHCERARVDHAGLILGADGTETLSNLVSVCMKHTRKHNVMKRRHQRGPNKSTGQPREGNPKPQSTGFGRQNAKSKSRTKPKRRKRNNWNNKQKHGQNAQKECLLLIAMNFGSGASEATQRDLVP